MLKKYNKFFLSAFLTADILFITFSWILAYVIRFDIKYPNPPGYIIPFLSHLFLLIIILPLYIFIFNIMGSHEPGRTISVRQQISNVFKTSSMTAFLAAFIIYFLIKNIYYPRLLFLYFWSLMIVFLSSSRVLIYTILRHFRKIGYNLRYILIIGAGKLACEVVSKIQKHPEFGLSIIGFLSRDPGDTGEIINGIKVLGCYKDIKETLSKFTIDQVIIALPVRDERLLRTLVGSISTETVDIKIVLDIEGFHTLRRTTEDLDGLPVISLRESPFYGWAHFIKRLLDIVISFLAIIISSPLLFLTAALIKLTSPGTVFYKQERVGLDEKSFQIIKFRTMKTDAEKDTGPVWSKENDGRITKIGAILRQMSIDELPQLFNVLKGDMSLVGPRPERPVFVDGFRKHIPKYMLRHKIKTGMTGWAQIHGWRGDTSIEKRIEYDIHYIEYWSIWLDLKILLLTIPEILRTKNNHGNG
jgi:Undecaprenyl-phosphate glucose phosphotransferase